MKYLGSYNPKDPVATRHSALLKAFFLAQFRGEGSAVFLRKAAQQKFSAGDTAILAKDMEWMQNRLAEVLLKKKMGKK